MSALEQELLDKFKNLNETQQREALDFVRKLAEKDAEKPFDWDVWLERARQQRESDRKKYGPNHFNVQEILDEIREEASEWPRKS